MLTILRYSPWTIYVRHKKHPYNYLSHRKLQGRSNWAHLWVNKHFEVHVSIFSMHVFNNIGVSVFIVCFMQLAVGPCINKQVSNRLYARLVFHICTNNTITGTERSWKKRDRKQLALMIAEIRRDQRLREWRRNDIGPLFYHANWLTKCNRVLAPTA